MPEGLFTPDQVELTGIKHERINAALVRIKPRTRLILDVVDTQDQVTRLSRNESDADGTERWFRYFLKDDLKRIDDPAFRMGMVRWEFSQLVKSGARFPAETWLDGGGSGFCISAAGLILTNYHLVTGEVAYHKRESGALNQEALCRALQVEVASQTDDGHWQWRTADRVFLVSNPPTARAIDSGGAGPAQLREDFALLRVEPAPLAALALSARSVSMGEELWMAGFPLRTARPADAKRNLQYEDADGTLRISSGKVTAVDGREYFTSDADGSMGNSGSAAIDRQGLVVGMFSRTTGNGPRNAFEYGHVERIFVSSALMTQQLQLE